MAVAVPKMRPAAESATIGCSESRGSVRCLSGLRVSQAPATPTTSPIASWRASVVVTVGSQEPPSIAARTPIINAIAIGSLAPDSASRIVFGRSARRPSPITENTTAGSVGASATPSTAEVAQPNPNSACAARAITPAVSSVAPKPSVATAPTRGRTRRHPSDTPPSNRITISAPDAIQLTSVGDSAVPSGSIQVGGDRRGEQEHDRSWHPHALGHAPKHERGQHRAAHDRHGHSELLHRHLRSWWSPLPSQSRRGQIIVDTASETVRRRRRHLRAVLRAESSGARSGSAASSELILDQAPRRLQPPSQLVVRPAVSRGVELRRGGHKPPKDDQGSRIDRGLLDPISHLDDPPPLIQQRAALRPAQGWEGARSKVARGRAGGPVGESQAPTQCVCEAPPRPRLLDRADAMPDSPLDRGSLSVPAESRQDQLVSAHDRFLMCCPAKRELDDHGDARQERCTAPTNGCGVWMGASHHAANPARNTPSPVA